MSYTFPRVKHAVYACIIASEFLSVTSFSPTFFALQRSATIYRPKISGRWKMVGDNLDLADMDSERMKGILELQRQTSYMNRCTTSSYLNKIQYDMTENVKVASTKVVEEKKPDVQWNIISSIEKKLKWLAGNALNMIFSSIFFISRESKRGDATEKRPSLPIFQKALLASRAISSKLRRWVISIISISQNLPRNKNSKSGPTVDHGPT